MHELDCSCSTTRLQQTNCKTSTKHTQEQKRRAINSSYLVSLQKKYISEIYSGFVGWVELKNSGFLFLDCIQVVLYIFLGVILVVVINYPPTEKKGRKTMLTTTNNKNKYNIYIQGQATERSRRTETI